MKRTSTIITASVIVGTAFSIYAGRAQLADRGASHSSANVDWPVYGGQLANQHYSGLTQINRNNVSKLKVAWTVDTGEEGGLETSPLIVGRTLYAYTPSQKVIALDPVPGKLFSQFDSALQPQQP